jgi:hypothetical protein
MLTFTKTKNTRLPDSVHNAGVILQSRDIPHTLPSPIFYERAPGLKPDRRQNLFTLSESIKYGVLIIFIED